LTDSQIGEVNGCAGKDEDLSKGGRKLSLDPKVLVMIVVNVGCQNCPRLIERGPEDEV
jgi:hypothetical protein